ncbi:MAG: ribonuclease J [Christensenellales bacterium]
MSGKKKTLRIIPLGGVGEYGKNMTVIEYGKDMIMIDSGQKFPGTELPGIDMVIPDISYVEANSEKLRAIILTHGHEDHTGSIAYTLKKVQAPIYGTPLTLGIAENKIKEHGIENVMLECITGGDERHIGCFHIEFLKMTHSIAGAVALAIHTPVGTVIHTGDFKIDHTPKDGDPMDIIKLAMLGDRGILLLMSDSTNAERPGYTMSEQRVGESFMRLFELAKGRIIVATFASNIQRIQQIIDSAVKFGRKVCFQGRSMLNIVKVARDLGELTIDDRQMVDIDAINHLSADQITIITTGSQGESMSGLVRMATGNHSKINVVPGDTVIISASQIPGNEKMISNVINNLYKCGAEVIYESMEDVHVSGHACQEELKLMLRLTKPKYFIPVHGEYRHLKHHADLAKDIGIPQESIFIMESGDVLEITHDSAALTSKVPAGNILVDGSGIGDVGNIVLRDRRLLSQDGLLFIVAAVEKETSILMSGPEVISRGFVYMRESEEMVEQIKLYVMEILKCVEGKPSDINSLKNQIKTRLRDYLYTRTKRNPIIIPVILEI